MSMRPVRFVHYVMKYIVEDASASVQKGQVKDMPRLHADRDVCKGSTDTPRKATQGCSATLRFARFCKCSGH